MKISRQGSEKLLEIQVEPGILQKIKRCQQKVWEEETSTITGKRESVLGIKKDDYDLIQEFGSPTSKS